MWTPCQTRLKKGCSKSTRLTLLLVVVGCESGGMMVVRRVCING